MRMAARPVGQARASVRRRPCPEAPTRRGSICRSRPPSSASLRRSASPSHTRPNAKSDAGPGSAPAPTLRQIAPRVSRRRPTQTAISKLPAPVQERPSRCSHDHITADHPKCRIRRHRRRPARLRHVARRKTLPTAPGHPRDACPDTEPPDSGEEPAGVDSAETRTTVQTVWTLTGGSFEGSLWGLDAERRRREGRRQRGLQGDWIARYLVAVTAGRRQRCRRRSRVSTALIPTSTSLPQRLHRSAPAALNAPLTDDRLLLCLRARQEQTRAASNATGCAQEPASPPCARGPTPPNPAAAAIIVAPRSAECPARGSPNSRSSFRVTAAHRP
jgi:hypothetical protein